MEQRFNPLDPLGILGAVKRDVDRIVGSAKLPVPPGLPGLTTKPHRGIGNPIPTEFNGKLVDMRQQARDRLVAEGFREPLISSALHWYDEWLMGMARRLAPRDIELQKRVVQSAYAEIAPRAESWMTGIKEAFGITETLVEKNFLTPTEHEVLRLAAEGLSNREIAERLFIAIGTVRVHLKDIRRRIGVATREEAVAAFGEPTERERVPISILRRPKPPVSADPYERRAADLLPLVDKLERSPSMETVGILEDALDDLAEEVIEARTSAYGIEATRFSDLHSRLYSTIQEVVLARAAIESMERETLPMRIEAARRGFLLRIQAMRKNLIPAT